MLEKLQELSIEELRETIYKLSKNELKTILNELEQIKKRKGIWTEKETIIFVLTSVAYKQNENIDDKKCVISVESPQTPKETDIIDKLKEIIKKFKIKVEIEIIEKKG